MNATAIRIALNARLATTGIFVYDKIPGTFNRTPCLVVYPVEKVDFQVTKGSSRSEWTILALIGQLDPTKQEFLEQVISSEGTYSILECLYADKKLGGAVSALRLLDIQTGLYTKSTGTEDILGVEFNIEIYA